jgi:hypothetical protein
VAEGMKLNYTNKIDTAWQDSEEEVGTSARPLPAGLGPGPRGSFTDPSEMSVLRKPTVHQLPLLVFDMPLLFEWLSVGLSTMTRLSDGVDQLCRCRRFDSPPEGMMGMVHTVTRGRLVRHFGHDDEERIRQDMRIELEKEDRSVTCTYRMTALVCYRQAYCWP